MKYFTSEWWSQGCTDSAVVERYSAYYDSIKHRLPSALVEFEAKHSLHDARLVRTICNFAEKTVECEFCGWDQALTHQVGYSLVFSGAVALEQLLPEGRDVQSELGDLGYWEYEMLSDAIEMRCCLSPVLNFV